MHSVIVCLSLTGNSLETKTYFERLVWMFLEEVLFLAGRGTEVVIFIARRTFERLTGHLIVHHWGFTRERRQFFRVRRCKFLIPRIRLVYLARSGPS